MVIPATPHSLPGETFVTVDADSVQVLLSFAVAHGSANSILDCLQILLDNLTLELPLAPLLRAVEDVRQQKVKQHGEPPHTQPQYCSNTVALFP